MQQAVGQSRRRRAFAEHSLTVMSDETPRPVTREGKLRCFSRSTRGLAWLPSRSWMMSRACRRRRPNGSGPHGPRPEGGPANAARYHRPCPSGNSELRTASLVGRVGAWRPRGSYCSFRLSSSTLPDPLLLSYCISSVVTTPSWEPCVCASSPIQRTSLLLVIDRTFSAT